jgi:hypothetical protein
MKILRLLKQPPKKRESQKAKGLSKKEKPHQAKGRMQKREDQLNHLNSEAK